MADIIAGRTYHSQPEADHSRVAQKALVGAIVVLSLVILGQLAYHLVLAPRLTITNIALSNATRVSDEQLLSIAGVRVGMPYLRTDATLIAEAIGRHPEVRSVMVDRVFPNSLSIAVSRRVALAAALAETDSGSAVLVFDDEGVVFQIGGQEIVTDLPVVSGLRFPEAAVGLRLPDLVVEFLRDLRAFKMSNPELYALWSEFRIVRQNDYAYEVVLYPIHFRVPIRVGTSINPDMIQYVLMMLDMLRNDGSIATVAELDVRSGEGVVRYRENSDGR